MIVTLESTTTSTINSELLKNRCNLGTTSGLVFTLVVDCPEKGRDKAVQASLAAGREHQSRIIVVVPQPDKPTKLDAELRFGEDVPGDMIILSVQGDLVAHVDTVVGAPLA